MPLTQGFCLPKGPIIGAMLLPNTLAEIKPRQAGDGGGLGS
jgi:hypothetical protein